MTYKYPICVAAKGLDHIAETILSYLDAESLSAAEQVCREWRRVIADGMLWKKFIERMVRTDPLWRGLAERRGWLVQLTKISLLLHYHIFVKLRSRKLLIALTSFSIQ